MAGKADAMKVAIEVLMRNNAEVAQIVERAGGWMHMIGALPAIYKIMQTVNAVNETTPEEAMPMQYGMQTFAEVKAFQLKHGLNADGIIGDRTWLKVKQLLGDKR